MVKVKHVKTNILIGIFIVLIIISGAVGYIVGQQTGAPVQQYTPPEKIKAAWIYVGPIGDAGWTFMHDIGRKYVETIFDEWLDTTYVESVTPDKIVSTVDDLVSKGYNVIFTTSFDFMDATIEAAKKYPNVMFFHCSGYRRAPNVGTYFADLYEVYYLNGLMAGALTQTGQIGYVAAYLIPEVVRHINAFAIGAKEVGDALGKNVTVHVIEIGSWYDPTKARQASDTLVRQYNVDVLAFTEDSSAVIEYGEEKGVHVFSHYGPMAKYGPTYTVSGQIVRWEVIYADILVKIKAGVLTPNNLDKVDYWYLLSSGAVDLGGDIGDDGRPVMINPRYEPILKGITVTDKLTGERISVYDLVMRRYWQMRGAFAVIPFQFSSETHKYENLLSITMNWGGMIGTKPYPIASEYDPFTGPLTGYCLTDNPLSTWCSGKAKGDTVNIPAGTRLGHDDLWNMDFFMSWVIKQG